MLKNVNVYAKRPRVFEFPKKKKALQCHFMIMLETITYYENRASD